MKPDQAPDRPGCYLIHFETPLGHAQHYKGVAEYSIRERALEHLQTICYPPEDGAKKWSKDGAGAKIMGVANYHFIDWDIARIWEDKGYEFETRLKAYGGLEPLCPRCSGQAAYGRMQG